MPSTAVITSAGSSSDLAAGPWATMLDDHDAVLQSWIQLPSVPRSLLRSRSSTPSHARVKLPVGDELVGNLFRQIDRNGETNSVVACRGSSVLMPMTSPSMLTSGPPLLPGLMLASVWMKSWSIMIWSRQDPSALGADVTEGDAVVQFERRADGDGKLADPCPGRVSELRRREALRRDFQDRNIRLGINPFDFDLVVFRSVLEPHHDSVRAFDDMAVREDVAVLADNQSRTFPVEDRPATMFLELLLPAATQFRHHVEERIVFRVQLESIRACGRR